MDDLLLEVRDPDLVRRDHIDLGDLLELKLALRHNALGGWSLKLPTAHSAVPLLRQPGWGVLATRGDSVLMSGVTVNPVDDYSVADPAGTTTIAGVDDNSVLADARAWPTPSTVDLEAQEGTDGSGYDQRTGVAETVMRAYVAANIGITAPAARRPAGTFASLLQLAPDLGRGAQVQGSARFETLLELLGTLGAAGGLGFRVRQDDLQLLLEIYVPEDRSARISFDLDNGGLRSVQHAVNAPAATVAILMGAGEDAARILQEVTTDDSIAAQAQWRRRIERPVDSSSTVDPDELTQVGVESLDADGRTVTTVTVDLEDLPGRQLGIDYHLGDRISAVISETRYIADVVTEVNVTLDAAGWTSKATIGKPDGAAKHPLVVLTRAAQTNQRRISAIERRR